MTTTVDIDPDVKAYIVAKFAEGSLDRQHASLVIATGAAAMGMDVSIFYAFWALAALKKRARLRGKSFKEKLFALMTPGGLSSLPVSQFNFAGIAPDERIDGVELGDAARSRVSRFV